MLRNRPYIQLLLIVTFLGGCFWTSGTGSSNLLLIRQQEVARISGLPALDLTLDVSEGFRLEGSTIEILPPSVVDAVKVDILVQDASKSWQATRSFDVPRDSLRKVQTFQNLDAGLSLRLRARLVGTTPQGSSSIIGDPSGHTLDLPPLTFSKRLDVVWTIPLPGGDLASPTISIN